MSIGKPIAEGIRDVRDWLSLTIVTTPPQIIIDKPMAKVIFSNFWPANVNSLSDIIKLSFKFDFSVWNDFLGNNKFSIWRGNDKL